MPDVMLKEGVEVFSPDGEPLGSLRCFILEPATNELTHIVVQRDNPTTEERVMPLTGIDVTAEERLVWNDRLGAFEQLPLFEQTQFVRVNDQEGWNTDSQPGPVSFDRTVPVYYWYPAQGHPGFPGYGLGARTWPRAETEPAAPVHSMPMLEKTSVISSDGVHVGDVERLFLEPDSNRVTHFLVSEGLFFQDHKLIPAGWIESADEDVHLCVPSGVLQRLPAYEL